MAEYVTPVTYRPGIRIWHHGTGLWASYVAWEYGCTTEVGHYPTEGAAYEALRDYLIPLGYDPKHCRRV